MAILDLNTVESGVRTEIAALFTIPHQYAPARRGAQFLFLNLLVLNLILEHPICISKALKRF